MSKKLEWAKDIVKRYESYLEQRGTSGGVVGGGPEYELYKLAQAIIDDVNGEMP